MVCFPSILFCFGGRPGNRLQIGHDHHIKCQLRRASDVPHYTPLTPLRPMAPKSRSKQKTAVQKRKRRDEPGSQDEGSDTNVSEDDVQALDSDNLDDDDDDADTARRGRKAGAKRKKRSSAAKPRKRRRGAVSEEEESDLELKEGQEVVGKIVRAPKTGQGELRTFEHRAQPDPFFL